MTKIDTKLRENISAYVDRELSEEEKHVVENELQKSASLRETVIEYRELSEKVSSLPELTEDVYFESRFFDTVNQKRIPRAFFAGYRKPIIAFSSLCVLFMVFYSLRPNFMKDVVDQHAQALLKLTENLKPLLFATNLTKDDMFNFAFSKTIPLNKENDQFIKLGVNQKGQEYIEVKGAQTDAGNLNYHQFVSSLRLKPDQVAASVLVNDKNTVAINSRIWSDNNDLRQELIAFAAHANPAAIKALIPHPGLVADAVKSGIPNGQNSNFYYCISADSFFTTPLNIDLTAIKKAVDAQKIEVKISKNIAQLQKKINIQIKGVAKNFRNPQDIAKNVVVSSDGRNVKVIIPDAVAPDNIYPGLDEITLRMDKVFENLKNFQFNPNTWGNDGRHVVGYRESGEDAETNPEAIYEQYYSRSPKVLQDTLKFHKMKNGKNVIIKVARSSPAGLNHSFNLDSLLNLTRTQIKEASSGKDR
jgi:hypothetical protein